MSKGCQHLGKDCNLYYNQNFSKLWRMSRNEYARHPWQDVDNGEAMYVWG